MALPGTALGALERTSVQARHSTYQRGRRRRLLQCARRPTFLGRHGPDSPLRAHLGCKSSPGCEALSPAGPLNWPVSGRERKHHAERRSVPDFGLDLETGPPPIEMLADDGQTQACSADAAALGVRSAEELLPQPGNLVASDADAAVPDGDGDT